MKLIDSILKKAEHPAYAWIVFFLTVCESVFLFVPPEVFMAPAIVANKKRAVPITIAASLGSLVGGAISYVIGAWLFDSIGIWLVNSFATFEKFQLVQSLFLKHGILIIILSAITPVPYKLVAMCMGFLHYPILIFLGIAAIFRTGRFATAGTLLYLFQKRANAIVRKYFWPLVLGAVTIAGCGIGLMVFF